ncbi:MAG: cobalamin biosynthesis protein CbiX [Verrucomicrobia bacterium]|nr:MAG: cobalamin biosynthesis protein CbiX [Verrucomicrobiota bacterium]
MSTEPPTILLFDNGSFRPDPTRRLRSIASALANRLDRPVIPTSLLHADKIDPVDLGGLPPRLLESEIVRRLEQGETRFTLLPFFIGPSNAITEYLPGRLTPLQDRHPGLETRIADSLARLGSHPDLRLADILSAQILLTVDTLEGEAPSTVVLVDHGSPVPSVTRIRDQIALELRRLLGDRVTGVRAASMERREGRDYDFNDPLLETALDRAVNTNRTVVVSLLFLAPGRHAGPRGDIDAICRKTERRSPGSRVLITGLAGGHPGIIDILTDRVREVES